MTILCDITGITRSGYYKWIKRHTTPSKKQSEDSEIKKKILKYQTKLRGIYGYRKIQVWLKATYNLHLSHKRIQRLMSELGIKAVLKKERPYYGKKKLM